MNNLTLSTEGLHPSTEACLQALAWLQERASPSNILEIGCGNGILSVLAAHMWDARVLAVDISEKALVDAQENIAQYGLSERISVLRSDGFSAPAIAQKPPYDLIIGNLLAELLLKFAPDIKNSLSIGGYALLAGALAWKDDAVRQTYLDLGFEIAHEIVISPWCCHVFRRLS